MLIGSIILIKPRRAGAHRRCDRGGNISLDTAALTGDPSGTSQRPGILSGSINLSGLLRVQTTKEFEESTASRIWIWSKTRYTQGRSEQFISKFARWYTPAVYYSALALAILGPLVNMLDLPCPGAGSGPTGLQSTDIPGHQLSLRDRCQHSAHIFRRNRRSRRKGHPDQGLQLHGDPGNVRPWSLTRPAHSRKVLRGTKSAGNVRRSCRRNFLYFA